MYNRPTLFSGHMWNIENVILTDGWHLDTCDFHQQSFWQSDLNLWQAWKQYNQWQWCHNLRSSQTIGIDLEVGDFIKTRPRLYMIKLWHGNAFSITGHLWDESTCQRWIPIIKGPQFDFVIGVSLEKPFNKKSKCRLFETWRLCSKRVAISLRHTIYPRKHARGCAVFCCHVNIASVYIDPCDKLLDVI